MRTAALAEGLVAAYTAGTPSYRGVGMLTWGDILKLCVPFVFSLALLWIKEWYVDWRERRRKQAFLWRTIGQGSSELIKALQALDRIPEALKEKRMRFGEFAMPAVNRECAIRLAELDHGHAHTYADYAVTSEIVDKDLKTLDQLLHAIITASADDRESLVKAIGARCVLVKRDLVAHAREELAVLRVIKKQNRKLDAQTLDIHANVVHDAEKYAGGVVAVS